MKVQFFWDRYGKKNETSSCWVRVSHPWAGKNFGAIHTPRIGQEVVVDFLEGDPDQPLITGRVYNAEQMPPWELPANATQSPASSRAPARAVPMAMPMRLRFEDKVGEEQLWLHAEKDQLTEVEHDEDKWVGNDRRKTIDRDETNHIKRDRTETVDRNEKITVHGWRTEEVDLDETITIHKNRSERVDLNENISIGASRSEDVELNETIEIGQNRSEFVGVNEMVRIGGNRSVSIGGSKTETVAMAKAESIGLAKALSIGLGYQTTVGGAMNTTVGPGAAGRGRPEQDHGGRREHGRDGRRHLQPLCRQGHPAEGRQGQHHHDRGRQGHHRGHRVPLRCLGAGADQWQRHRPELKGRRPRCEMEFVNLTPFGAMAYRGVDVHGREYDVFAMRTVYRLERLHPTAARLAPGLVRGRDGGSTTMRHGLD